MLEHMIRDTCDKTSEPVADPSLGDLLGSLRQRAKITQKQLGLAMGKSAGWVGRIERRGRCMGLMDFIRWCECCDADPFEAIEVLENAMSGQANPDGQAKDRQAS